jgi:PAS domain S-box-containing protein
MPLGLVLTLPMPRSELTAIEYRTLVEQAPILIWRADLSMGCDYFNDRWLQFTGRTLQQELGNGWAEGVHPEDFDDCLKIYTSSFARREIFEMEYRLRRHDGAWRWIFDRGVPFNNANGVFAGYIGSCVDVTERREAQEALKAAHASEVKTLRGLLPICAACKRIRDDRGYWDQLERYFKIHADVNFTHSICPECAQKFYGDLGVGPKA